MPVETDALIVGAGPCGLFQVFELGLLGLKADIVDTMNVVGGQCAELYPDKPIYDVPAIPVCSAQELVDQLLEQIKPFDAGFHLGQEVSSVNGDGSGPFEVTTTAGTEFLAKTVFIAGGVGSFQPRKVRVEGMDRFDGQSMHYQIRDPRALHGQNLVILGGGDSALDWALELCPHAKSLVLAHRSSQFRAAPVSVERMRELVAAEKMRCLEGVSAVGFEEDAGRLTAVIMQDAEKQRETLTLDSLLVFFGLAPKLGPIAEWGLDINRKTINVDTEKFQTSVPGIYAIGDIANYPGKKKLILSGFHEAALAAFAAKEHIEPGKKVHLQYTTTSPIMHKRLGIQDAEE